MSTEDLVNEYHDLSPIEAFNKIKEDKLILPDIQREYVWERYQIEDLFESIARGYPIGTFIFWTASIMDLKNSKQKFYKFIKNKMLNVESNSTNDEFNLNLVPDSPNKDYFIVLDGQQRITSIYIGLQGIYYFKRKYKIKNKVGKSRLFFNLNYSEDFDSKMFIFDEETSYTSDYLKEKKIFPMEKIYEYLMSKYDEIKNKNTIKSFINEINTLLKTEGFKEKDYNASCLKYLAMFCYRMVVNKTTRNDALIHYYNIKNQNNDYDSALDIFVKVNSTGTRLSKNDLIFSKLIKGWDRFNKKRSDPKKEINDILKNLNMKDKMWKFDLRLDYLIRCAIYVTSDNSDYKIKSLDEKTINTIRVNWDEIIDAISCTINYLKDNGYSYYSITSYNSLLPIIYFIYYGGELKNNNEETFREIQKYLIACSTTNIFSNNSPEVLKRFKDCLNNVRGGDKKKFSKTTKFEYKWFKDIEIHGKKVAVTEKDIDSWLKSYKKGGKQTFLLLLSLYRFNYVKEAIAKNEYDQDHLHPKNEFKKTSGIDANIFKEWEKKSDLIPNLQLLASNFNRGNKKAIPLKQWIESGNKDIPCMDDLLNTNDDILEFKNFDKFYNIRYENIKDYFIKLFLQ